MSKSLIFKCYPALQINSKCTTRSQPHSSEMLRMESFLFGIFMKFPQINEKQPFGLTLIKKKLIGIQLMNLFDDKLS